MGILNFKAANCKNCYKCLRSCPVKAISFNEDNAQVIDDKCILCGHCVSVCPQNAKRVTSSLDKINEILAGNSKVVASIAPSCVSSFGDYDIGKIYTALNRAGFLHVENTAVGAAIVTQEYERLVASGKYKNFITSACPSIVRMIQYDYHDALKYLAPIDSPMVAHAKYLKREHGEDTKVVFIGPCIAKIREARESGVIDAVMTFDELTDWLFTLGINIDDCQTQDIDYKNKSLFYPISRGIIKSLYHYCESYDYVYVDGVMRCRDVLANIDNLTGMFIEMSACESSCVNGPCKRELDGGFLKANESVRKYAKTNLEPRVNAYGSVDTFKRHDGKSNNMIVPSEKEMTAILAKFGKYTPEDMLNCGACGYESCRDKAIAVYNGMANPQMCIPYMRERAENLSVEMFKNSPNAVISVDYDLIIQEINDVARNFFGIEEHNLKGKSLVDYINPTEFMLAINGERIIDRQIHVSHTDRWGKMNIYKVDRHDMVLCTINDITVDMALEQNIKKVRLETAETTQKVIEKQMSIVQEIASLLGETTADTKVALTKLKNIVMEEYDE